MKSRIGARHCRLRAHSRRMRLPLPAHQVHASQQATQPDPNRFCPADSSNRDSRGLDDDESIDDTMLIMPVDSALGPPSAWGSTAGSGMPRARPRSELSGSGAQGYFPARTLGHAVGGGQAQRARSTISIERSSGTMRGKGSVSIGRRTMRKASGAGVEAIGVTASGFFAPPVPPLPSSADQPEGG
jgi:Rho GTPase-activating protein 1